MAIIIFYADHTSSTRPCLLYTEAFCAMGAGFTVEVGYIIGAGYIVCADYSQITLGPQRR